MVWKNTFFDPCQTAQLLDVSLVTRSPDINVLKTLQLLRQKLHSLSDPPGSFALSICSIRCVLHEVKKTSMCLRCAKAAYSFHISIQLQQKGSAELPLIGRAAREESVCLSRASGAQSCSCRGKISDSTLENIKIEIKTECGVVWLCLYGRAK